MEMQRFKYLIVGGGMTAAAALEGIRSVDPAGSIGIIGAETDPPYNRPPLSKALWKGESVDTIWRKIDFPNVTFCRGQKIQNLDPAKKEAVDTENKAYAWDKLLLATGGSPRRLPFGDEHVIYYRTFSDYQRLRASTQNAKHYAVIGGGFIGSEIAAALALNGKEVTMIFPAASLCDRVFPRDLSKFVTEFY